MFPIVEKQLPSMIQSVSAASSIPLWTSTWNSSAGQACQFGSIRRASKLVYGMFNNLESLTPNVVYRRTRLPVNLPDPSPISGFERAARVTMIVGTSDMMAAEWQEVVMIC
jgi:hypothetical protein